MAFVGVYIRYFQSYTCRYTCTAAVNMAREVCSPAYKIRLLTMTFELSLYTYTCEKNVNAMHLIIIKYIGMYIIIS